MKFVHNGSEASFEHLGDYVRAQRLARGYTQRQLAGVSGVGPRFVSELENGKKPNLSFAHVQKVLAVLGLELVLHDRSLPWPPGPPP